MHIQRLSVYPRLAAPVNGIEVKKHLLLPSPGDGEGGFIPQGIFPAHFFPHTGKGRFRAERNQDLAVREFRPWETGGDDGIVPKTVKAFPFPAHKLRTGILWMGVGGANLIGPGGADTVSGGSPLGICAKTVNGGAGIDFTGTQDGRGETGLVHRIGIALGFKGKGSAELVSFEEVAAVKLHSRLVCKHFHISAGNRIGNFAHQFNSVRLLVKAPVVVVAAGILKLDVVLPYELSNGMRPAEIERRPFNGSNLPGGDA